MRLIRNVTVTAVFILAAFATWRVGSGGVANLQLQEDMHDLASQSANPIRYTPLRSDDEFRDAVVRKAREHGIELAPSQVVVQHTSSATAGVYLAADYRVPVNLPWFSLTLHFTPSSAKNTF